MKGNRAPINYFHKYCEVASFFLFLFSTVWFVSFFVWALGEGGGGSIPYAGLDDKTPNKELLRVAVQNPDKKNKQNNNKKKNKLPYRHDKLGACFTSAFCFEN